MKILLEEAMSEKKIQVTLGNYKGVEVKKAEIIITEEEIEEEIKDFKQENPESYVVVILHWGIEYQSSPTLNQRKGAHRLVRAGADAIIGHHPHVIQKEEYFNGKPIFYSLGNFVFDQRKPETSQSLIVQLNFTSIGYSIKLHPATINNCKPELQ